MEKIFLSGKIYQGREKSSKLKSPTIEEKMLKKKIDFFEFGSVKYQKRELYWFNKKALSMSQNVDKAGYIRLAIRHNEREILTCCLYNWLLEGSWKNERGFSLNWKFSKKE